jgi:hypothetical protein
MQREKQKQQGSAKECAKESNAYMHGALRSECRNARAII